MQYLNKTKKLLKEGKFDAYKTLIDNSKKLGIFTDYPHNPAAGHFIPHFGVERDSTTTPLRMVFSACTGSPSINDCLYPGISLLEDLPTLIRQIRCFPIAFSGDVAKAFNSIARHEEDIPYTKLLWWANGEPFTEIISLAQKMVSFGFNDSPFNYFATMITHCDKHPNIFAKTIPKSMYSDNYLTGAFTLEKALTMIFKAIAILKDGNWELRKFVTNHTKLREELAAKNLLDTTDTPSLLGLLWSTKDDELMFNVPAEPTGVITKRQCLSYFSGYYSPLGLLSPINVNSVAFLGDLWDKKYSWDEELKPEDQLKFEELKKALK